MLQQLGCMLDNLSEWMWHLHCQVATHSPFILQPMTVFIIAIDAFLALFLLFDKFEKYCSFLPKSLHPPSGRKYQERLHPVWRSFLFWNGFAYLGYWLYDVLAGTHSSMVLTYNQAAPFHRTLSSSFSSSNFSAIMIPSVPTDVNFDGVLGAVHSALIFPPSPSPSLSPSFLRFLFEVAVLTLGFELNFYFLHRILHTPWFWRTVHHRHHEVELVDASSIYYADFSDGIINFSSIVFPAVLFPAHPMARNFYYILIGVLGACSHSGWDVALGSSRFHFIHHMKRRCNFGVIGIMDRLFGSYMSMADIIATNPLYQQGHPATATTTTVTETVTGTTKDKDV